jgi:hypothetical protein
MVHIPVAFELVGPGESREAHGDAEGFEGESTVDQNSGQNGRTEIGAGDQIGALHPEAANAKDGCMRKQRMNKITEEWRYDEIR